MVNGGPCDGVAIRSKGATGASADTLVWRVPEPTGRAGAP